MLICVSPQVMNVLWWYYFSKFIELMDTVFFILRKNNHQLTFLHVYHHISMLNIWWFVLNWLPCGHSYFGPTLNSFVHVVMYSYYGLSAIPAMRPYLWWKKYITQLQLIQFFLTVLQTLGAIIWPCGVPIGWLYFQIIYMSTLTVFFSNFYIQTYKTDKRGELINSASLSTNGHSKRNATLKTKMN
ncbi:elongation of very long chain fatty acids protein 5 [Hippocampus zosterae]|uniref:elongation of very long chain fatty acids protein 5 n=1 Tax=Hippocampus zosterae TaxID=109293 RepID=UPI00223DF182|nr:elongation of very long chain fatty acids protein 5 [Hippocampus zosterae]